ncbi:glutathione S-transferase family protein [Acidiphilium sp.]|uniref:glutathione S-transferase family protein n=1 Tax=Acidiphilium sp. TaxID=527 RepID=UPI003D037934
MSTSGNVLYLGNRRYSSWSLRGWLAVQGAGLAVSEQVIPLNGGQTPAVRAVSPSGFVPVLAHDGARIWDSLAIVEYCAEINRALWPADRIARGHARSISAEMHSGFRDLRIAMPMNCCRVFPGRGVTPASSADIARIEAIWADTRARFGAGGAFLFGADFTGADIMFAPVVARFLTYQPVLSATSHAYMAAVRAHPDLVAWYDAAAAEPDAWMLAKYEEAA